MQVTIARQRKELATLNRKMANTSHEKIVAEVVHKILGTKHGWKKYSTRVDCKN